MCSEVEGGGREEGGVAVAAIAKELRLMMMGSLVVEGNKAVVVEVAHIECHMFVGYCTVYAVHIVHAAVVVVAAAPALLVDTPDLPAAQSLPPWTSNC